MKPPLGFCRRIAVLSLSFATGRRGSLWLLLPVVVLAACAGSTARPDVDPFEGVGGKKRHVKEERLINYYDAATILEKADEFYKKEEWADAAAEYERFVDLHLLHPQAAVALFRLGISAKQQVSTMDRDQEPLRKALAAFRRLLAEFPDSPHAAEAKTHITWGRRMQADRQLAIGRFYYRQGQYPAAIARLKQVPEEFADLEPAAEALYYLALAYREVGETPAARTALTTLLAQHPTARHHARAERVLATLPGAGSE